ncbi:MULTISPECIES: hypothetical protein [Sutterella]|uniref:hypothetical protein n=1 Tax=Sutterella TaxID=40544 RepID=UPI00265CD696|nr:MULTISPECIES: hypothetical protein [Sutterella]MDR3966505.1 hypothetical protein [Sutterella sp.]
MRASPYIPVMNDGALRLVLVRLFLHQLTVDKGLPFRPTIDPFFNEANLRYLERAIAEAKAGKNIEQHQLLDV